MCSNFFPGCRSGGSRCSHNASILTCFCTMRPYRTWSTGVQTTAESSDIPPIHYSQHVQQSVGMSIQLPAGLQCDPVQMAEIVQLVDGAWLYPRVNVANTIHLSKHHSYCLQRHKQRPPERHLIADDRDK